MSEEESLPPQVEYWLSPDSKHDCYFIVGSESELAAERIGAFKAFLIGYSEPLRAMLQDSQLAEKGDVPIVDIEPDTFKEFLKCLYMSLSDTIIRNLSFQKCCDLLYVADKYLVSQLKEKLIEQCLNILSSDTKYIISCINVACSSTVFMQETCLKSALSEIVQSQILNITSSKEFHQTTDDGLMWILQLDSLDIDEISLWLAVIKWAKNKTNSNNSYVVRVRILKLLKYVRFCAMDGQDFCAFVVPTNVLTGEEVSQICKYYGTKKMPNMEFICNVVTRRYHSNDSKLVDLPSVITFSFHVSEILRFMIRRCSGHFEFLDFNWSIGIKRDLPSNTLAFAFSCKGSKSNPNWNCTVRAKLTIMYNEGPNKTVQFTDRYFCGENPKALFKSEIPWSKVMDPSKNLTIKKGINTVLVTLNA